MNGIFIYFLIEYPSEVLYMVKRDKKMHKKKVNETSHITLSNMRYYWGFNYRKQSKKLKI